ncbi:MAG: hypothetical protein JWP91_4189 [Fibrobacteres bacterium]|nr:hypothetical protein [Fibrobacterota bacterium]
MPKTNPSHFAFLLLIGLAASRGFGQKDVFGIGMLMPSRQPAQEWNSLHWASGAARSITERDPADPTHWSRRRGDGNLMAIDGEGVMTMGGPQPRLYIMPLTAGGAPFFRDIEFTGYYRRIGADGESYAGFVVGARSGAEGHGDVYHCLANTYYLAFRNSGTWGFDKELDHPNDAGGKSGPLFPGGFPADRWIGMKYLVYNLPGDKAVKLEAYVDSVSGGDMGKGVAWKKLGEVVDSGQWSAPPGTCGYPANTVITTGGGVTFIRNTGSARSQYKMISWREIAPGGAVNLSHSVRKSERALSGVHGKAVRMDGKTIPARFHPGKP